MLSQWDGVDLGYDEEPCLKSVLQLSWTAVECDWSVCVSWSEWSLSCSCCSGSRSAHLHHPIHSKFDWLWMARLNHRSSSQMALCETQPVILDCVNRPVQKTNDLSRGLRPLPKWLHIVTVNVISSLVLWRVTFWTILKKKTGFPQQGHFSSYWRVEQNMNLTSIFSSLTVPI